MRYRRFGKTEMLVSQISLGCMRFTGDSLEETAIRTVERAVELGINHIETARAYGNSEERVGKSLKRVFRKVPREKVYVTTKIGPSSNVEEFKANFELSMKLLGLDYLDNLDFHGPGDLESIRSTMTPNGCLGYVRRLQDQKVLRHFGFSTHGYPKGVMDLVNTQEFASVNIHYYYFYQGLADVVRRCHELDMGLFIISPNDKGGSMHLPTPAFEATCQPLHPVTFGQMWLLSDPRVHTLSCGPATPDQIDRNLLAADFDGTGSDGALYRDVADRVDAAYRAKLGQTYCTVCNACLPCPEEINIPGLLNLRNLTVAFEMKEYAAGRYAYIGSGGAWVLGVKGDKCTACGDCLPRCPEKLAIPQLLWDTHTRLETGKISKPLWQHEGDLIDVDLKQQ